MNFSFASAPTTPFLPQVDGRTTAAPGAGLGAQFLSPGNVMAPLSATVASSTSMSRATDPLHDIGSPAALQYLFAMSNSPLVFGEPSMPMSSPQTTTIGMPPKRTQPASARSANLQPPALIVTSSPSASGALAIGSMAERPVVQATAAMAASPSMDSHPPRFFRPSEVFTTPEIRMLPDIVGSKTPELALFDDADAVTSAAMPLSALSPRTQTAQAGLTLLAASASASYARDAGQLTPDMAMLRTTSGASMMALSPHQQNASQSSLGGIGSPIAGSDTQATAVMGAAFLNANGNDPTLMSQPHNSLAHHMSPPMVDRGARNITRLGATSGPFAGGLSVLAHTSNPALQTLTTAAATGRLTRNRSLLRQSSGLTNASFHNDLVPQATESFFAPLDEVCSDGAEQTQQPQTQPQPQTQHHYQQQPPPMGVQFSPAMPLAANQQPAWATSQRMGGSASPMVPSGQYAGLSPLSPLARTVAPHTAIPSPASGHVNYAPGAIFSQMPSLTTAPPPPQPAPAGYMYDDEFCGDSQSDSGQSKRRRTGKHKRDQERRFDCDCCDRSFARQYNLKTHRLTHFPDTNESRPYKCPSCPKAFTRRHDLQRHAVLHERSGKHICEKCLQGFPRKDSLKNHQKLECTS